jgi:hypothetical protein
MCGRPSPQGEPPASVVACNGLRRCETWDNWGRLFAAGSAWCESGGGLRALREAETWLDTRCHLCLPVG